MTTHSDKYERLQRTLAGEAPDRVPVAMWRHWPGDDERVADFARAVIDFQCVYDWDFIRIQPASSCCTADYGVQSVRSDGLSGDRMITRWPIGRSLEWTRLRPLNPQRGELGKHLAVLEMVREALPEVPLVTTIYSPLAQARMMAADDAALRHLRTQTKRLRQGLEVLTETLLTFITELAHRAIDGVFYVLDAADFSLMAKEEYARVALPFDRQVIEAFSKKWWLNALELPGPAPMFDFAASYPLPVLHWDAQRTSPQLAKAREQASNRVLAAGWSAEAQLYRGTPATIRDIAREQITAMEGRCLILTAGGALPVGTALSNLRAAREAVEMPQVRQA